MAYAIDLIQAEALWSRHAAESDGVRGAPFGRDAGRRDVAAGNTALYDEASSSRWQAMEAAILLLIFVELVLVVSRF